MAFGPAEGIAHQRRPSTECFARTSRTVWIAIGRAGSGGGVAAKPASRLSLWLGVCAAVTLLGSGFLIAFAKRRTRTEGQPLRARDVLKMPGEVDGFSVVALLRRLRTSPLVNLREPQQQELQQDLQRVQQACFSTNPAMSETDLRSVAATRLLNANGND